MWTNRLLWLVVAAYAAFGVIGPTAYRLLSRYVYGSRAAAEDIRVVKVFGRFVQLSNGETLHESEFDGLIFAMFLCIALTAAACWGVAKLIERLLLSRLKRTPLRDVG